MNYYSRLVVFPVSIPIYWKTPVCKLIKKHIIWHAAFHNNSFRGSPVPSFKNIKKRSEAYTHVTYMHFLWYKALHDLQRIVKYWIQLFFLRLRTLVRSPLSPLPQSVVRSKKYFLGIFNFHGIYLVPRASEIWFSGS